jgi:hypothetical protein
MQSPAPTNSSESSKRQVYAFWNGDNITTQVTACDEGEARRKALEPENVTIATNRPDENPNEFKQKILNAKIKTYPLRADFDGLDAITAHIARPPSVDAQLPNID